MTAACGEKNEHLVVRDPFPELADQARTVPGDCYCARCQQPVAFWFNGGAPTPAVQPDLFGVSA